MGGDSLDLEDTLLECGVGSGAVLDVRLCTMLDVHLLHGGHYLHAYPDLMAPVASLLYEVGQHPNVSPSIFWMHMVCFVGARRVADGMSLLATHVNPSEPGDVRILVSTRCQCVHCAAVTANVHLGPGVGNPVSWSW